MDELRALKLIKERFGGESVNIAVGIGDDTAAFCADSDKYILTTTDSQVQDVHFHKNTITPRQLARRSVAVSVSDIAAMGGRANYILATAGFSEDCNEEYIDSLMDGFSDAEIEFSVKLIGGNLTSADKIFLDITVLGEVNKNLVVRRQGARKDDLIFVSGILGDSALGQRLLDSNSSFNNGYSYLIDRHNMPSPRLTLGRELAERQYAHSMIDISDGLLLDLGRISADLGLGARVDVNSIPLSEHYEKYVTRFCDDKYELALSGGEDYELLFTTGVENREKINALSAEIGVQITEIGTITDSAKISIIDEMGVEKKFTEKGFVHFRA